MKACMGSSLKEELQEAREAKRSLLNQRALSWGDPNAKLSHLLGDVVSASYREPPKPKASPPARSSVPDKAQSTVQEPWEHWNGMQGEHMPSEATNGEEGDDEDAAFQMLDLRLQLNELDAENMRLRKQLEQQCELNKQMQEALLLGGAEQGPPTEPQMPPPSVSDASSNATALPSPSAPQMPQPSVSDVSSNAATLPSSSAPSPCTSTLPPQVLGTSPSSTSSTLSHTWSYCPPATPPSNLQPEQQFSPQWLPMHYDQGGSLNLHEQACCNGHQPPMSSQRPHAVPLQAYEWGSWEAPLQSQLVMPPAACPSDLSLRCKQDGHSALESRGSDGALAAVLEVEEYERQQRLQQQQQQRQLQQQQQLQQQPQLRQQQQQQQQWQKTQTSTPAQTWACQACTYVHSGKEAMFIRCAICNALK
ncbi:hypothetical protein DUNSADRAFT_11939 [Dunaliella salina]|uniref:Uncharacterized protein n=1 Tax=Dunaliella salina TaxID=3046 RepID=A0ABQ7GCA3_DUNSA|nr:hypothetical protein DUNSADRAFT_11939 [Dunaliella salina]|eukprot:KAF5832239.1 hypothetical protein DUNSADRAFT_11939 [Dunaliella salina]